MSDGAGSSPGARAGSPSQEPAGIPRSSAFDRALEQMGRAIVSGELPAGHVDSVEGLTARTEASRSVIREVVRVLGSLGMLAARRRVGLTVLEWENWDVIDPLVVRWRLAGPDRRAAIAELRALRRAVEPAAARDAAKQVGSREAAQRADAAALLRCVEDLAAATTGPAFAAADRAFHRRLLALSGNMLFQRLGGVIDEVLEDRASGPTDSEDVTLHRELAAAIGRGDPGSAEALMRRIIDRT